jgi:hypothetical protein
MRSYGASTVAGAALVAAALASCGNDGGSSAGAATSSRPSPSVSVEPRHGRPGTIFVFEGRGWRPRVEIQASYGRYCARKVCRTVALAKRFRPDADGKFTFHFREGRADARGVPQPGAAGNGPVTFERFAGPPYHSRLVRRTPRYHVDR